jgi:hypothetical protein
MWAHSEQRWREADAEKGRYPHEAARRLGDRWANGHHDDGKYSDYELQVHVLPPSHSLWHGHAVIRFDPPRSDRRTCRFVLLRRLPLHVGNRQCPKHFLDDFVDFCLVLISEFHNLVNGGMSATFG